MLCLVLRKLFMPTCRNCHRTIGKFDADVCPYCGTTDPIDSQYRTKDMTSFIDPQKPKSGLYRSKSRKTAALLCVLLGFTGAHDFYLGYKKNGLINIIFTLCFVGIIGTVMLVLNLTHVIEWSIPGGYLLPFAADFLFHVGYGLRYLFKDSLKDGNGVFLR